MSQRLIAAVALAALTVPAVALADEHRYVAIKSARMGADSENGMWYLQLVGKLDTDGDTTPTPVRKYRLSGQSQDGTQHVEILQHCQKQAVLAMSKPGRYRVDLTVSSGNETLWYLRGCGLTAIE